MRVLHVFKTYLPDSFTGVERVIWEIAEGTARFGVRNHVFYLSDKASRRPMRIGRHWIYSARRDLDVASTPLAFCALGDFCALARRVDVIHYHFPWPTMDIYHLAGRVRTPSIVTYHSDIVRQKTLLGFYKPVMHRFLKSVDRIVATSPNYIASSAVLAAYRNKTSVIPIGLDPLRLDPPLPERKQAWRQKLPPRFFLFIGALRYYKGLPFLIEAARICGLPVVLAGAGNLNVLNLPPNVIALGKVDDEDKAALLALSEGFVFPSHLRSEAFGVALLEAAFAGKAMISCEIGTGSSYVNFHEVTGLVVPPANADALAGAMQILWNNTHLSYTMGQAAKDRAHSLFLAENMVKSYHTIYRDLVT